MRILKPWEKIANGTDDPEEIQRIFARRRKRAGFLFLLGLFGNPVLAAVCIYGLGMSKEEYSSLGLPLFNLILPIGVIYILRRYRCPRCNAMPKSRESGTKGILLFPKHCANCDAALMPEHPWAQS